MGGGRREGVFALITEDAYESWRIRMNRGAFA